MGNEGNWNSKIINRVKEQGREKGGEGIKMIGRVGAKMVSDAFVNTRFEVLRMH